MTFGEKLQQLRQKEGFSQDKLAELLEVSRQAVSRWERDETMPETSTVVRLAEIFHVTTDYLLREDPTPEPEEKKPQESGDTVSRLGRLAKAKGYYLGWVLIAWGAADILRMFAMQFAWGAMINLIIGYGASALRRMPIVFSIYGAVKIAAGILVIHYGKRYAKKQEEHE